MKKILAILLAVLVAACATTSPPPAEIAGAGNGMPYVRDAAKTGFAVHQFNQPVAATWEDGYLTYRLKSSSFSFRTRYDAVRIYLSEKDVGEFRDTGRTKPHVLSSALSGASSPDAVDLFVADHEKPLSPNNALNADHGLKALSARENSYEVKSLYFLKTSKDVGLAGFSGTLFGYAWVDMNGDGKMGPDEVSRIRFILAK